MRSRTYRSPDEPELSAEEWRRWVGPPSRSRRLKWRLEAWAYAGIEAGISRLPLPFVCRIGAALGAVASRLAARRRRVVACNLRIAFGEKLTTEQIEGLGREVFRRAGANLLGALSTARLAPDELERAVEIQDMEVWSEAAARGRGVVMVLAHMGNWEALAQWMPRLLPPGMSGATVYRPLNNPIMNERFKASRRRMGIELFSRDDNPLGMASFLRRGGVLGVLADQRAGKLGELVPFFGRMTSCAPIPAILARRTGAALVGISLTTLAPGRWRLRFHTPEPEAEPTTAGVMRLVERMTEESPADVFWLQERWRADRRAPHLVPGKTARAASPEPTRRRRVLVWTGEVRAPAPVPPDVDYERVGAEWTRAAGESIRAFLRRVDAGQKRPLDYVVGGDAPVREACRRLGVAWVAGENT